MAVYGDNVSDADALPWVWKECTRLRIIEAYEFCLTVKPFSRWSSGHVKKETTDTSELLGPSAPLTEEPYGNIEHILAAVGLGSAPPAARRGVLTDDFFQGPHGEQIQPRTETPPELSDIIPKVVKRSDNKGGVSAPLMTLPYPFTAQGAHMSSADRVPFPPSPVPSGSPDDEEEEDDGEDIEEEEEEAEGDDEGGVADSEDPSSGRASGSMSSLGRPVSSRYPFQFRRPTRGTSLSSGAASNATPHTNSNSNGTNSQSIQSRMSRATRSTGNRESTDSQSPMSHYTTSSGPGSPMSQSSPIPMPPRHPRARAGTVPIPSSPASPSPANPPRARPRTRAESSLNEVFGAHQLYSDHDYDEEEELSDEDVVMEQPEPEGPQEAAEGEDVVGLLSHSRGPTPKTSLTALRHRASNSLSPHARSHRSRSSPGSRANSQSGSSSSRSRTGSSISIAVRSRAQSLIHSLGAASHSSLELVQTVMRTRANSSMARLEEDIPSSSEGRTHSRSGSSSDPLHSSVENYTFGQPLRPQWQNQEEPVQEEGSVASHESEHAPLSRQESQSHLSVTAPSQRPSERTVSPPSPPSEPSGGMLIPGRGDLEPGPSGQSSPSSHADISTAAQSFVTAPATIEGTTDDSGRTISSWGGISHMVDRSDGTWRPA